jgi:hypothetical protein
MAELSRSKSGMGSTLAARCSRSAPGGAAPRKAWQLGDSAGRAAELRRRRESARERRTMDAIRPARAGSPCRSSSAAGACAPQAHRRQNDGERQRAARGCGRSGPCGAPRRRQLRCVIEQRDVDVRVARLSPCARHAERWPVPDAARGGHGCPRGVRQRQHAAMLVGMRRRAGAIGGRRVAGFFSYRLGAFAAGVHQFAVLGAQVVRDEQEVQRRHHMADAEQQHEPQPSRKRARATRGAGCPRRKTRGAGCPRRKTRGAGCPRRKTRGAGCPRRSTRGAGCPRPNGGGRRGPARHGSELTGSVETGQAAAPALQNATGSLR